MRYFIPPPPPPPNGINLIFAAIHLSEAPGGGAPAGDQEGLGGFHLPMGFGETR